MAILTGPHYGPVSGGAPRQLVVLCHGLGADGSDLISLAPLLGAELPEAVFVAPDGPEPCDMSPHGRQWFSLRDFNPQRMAAGARAAAKTLNAFIDAELARWGITKFALAGFSQGAMMALFTGLRRLHNPPQAILAYSGALLAPETLGAELAGTPRILVAHGEADTVVPVAWSRLAATQLGQAGLAVETVFTPDLDHAIGDDGLAAGLALLRAGFGVA